MTVYGPNTNLEGGVPFGGIGTGKIEIDNRGKMSNVTISNNWGSPIKQVRGFHVFISPDEGPNFFVEKFLPMKDFSEYEPDELTYTGDFPFASLKARKGKVEANVEIFSSLVPGNLDDSTIPAIGISVKVKGSASGRVAVSMVNIAGAYRLLTDRFVGRINKSIAGGVRFVNLHCNDYDEAKGDLCLVAENISQKVVQYNINVHPRVAFSDGVWKYTYENKEPWLSIKKRERLVDDPHEILGQWDDPGSVVICKFDQENQEMKYVLSWYITGRGLLYPYGHYYHNKFGGAEEVATYFMHNYDSLRAKSRAWHYDMIRQDLPSWLKDAIINTTSILVSSSWLDEKGRFALIEATQYDPNVGIAPHGLCYETGTLPLLVMFPLLEKVYLRLLAKAARPDGYIPHDLGIHSFDHATDGTTSPPGWRELGPAFILTVYRHYKWTNDKSFLEEMYPVMIRALEWDLKQDRDNDGLPEVEGIGESSFDATSIVGVDSLVSSVFIASLIALREAAKVFSKSEDAVWLSELVIRAKKSFNSLYNGKYFEAWKGVPDSNGYVSIYQLTGEWWANLLGLESITDKEKIDSAFDVLWGTNGQSSKYGTPNIVREDMKIWELTRQAYSSEPRAVFAFAGYRFRIGDKKWLDIAKKEWDNLVQQGCVWNQPSRMDGRNGRPDPEVYFLDHYLGSAAPWMFTIGMPKGRSVG